MTLLYRGGCFLPLLIIFNFLFGWIFFSIRTWLLIELILFAVLFLYGYILSRKIFSQIDNPTKKVDAIDVEGKVLK